MGKIVHHIAACGAVVLFILGGSHGMVWLTETTDSKWLLLTAPFGLPLAAIGALILWALLNRKRASDRSKELAELAAFDAACYRFNDAIADFRSSPTGEKALAAVHLGDDLHNLTKVHNGGTTEFPPGYEMVLDEVRNEAKVATAIAPPLLAASLVAVALFTFPTTTPLGAFWAAWLTAIAPPLVFFTGWYGWQRRRKGKEMEVVVLDLQQAC